MNYKIFFGVLLAFAIESCSPNGHENEKHDEHEEVKFQYTA